MNIQSLLKYERRHRGLYNYLPPSLDEIKKTDAETYTYRAQFQTPEIERPEFTRPLREKGRNRIFLEIAGGVSGHALRMMKDGYKVISSDIAEGMVSRAKQFAVEQGISENGEFMVIDAENLPFKDETLDGIFMIASLHHIPHPEKALKEFQRCLKKNGCVLIGYEPATWQYYVFYPFIKLARYLIRRRRKDRPISIADDITHGFSKRKLRRLLRRAGFSRIKITPIYYTYKAYKNYCILLSKLRGEEKREHQGIKKTFRKIDRGIAKIPIIKNLTWDWDAVGYKS